MSGYRCFMRSVKLNFLLMFFLILGLSYQGYADCPNFVTSNTWFEAIVSGDWVKEIKVQAIKDQGVDGYFNPKIRVCAYDGKSYCYNLQSGESCRQIYGTQSTGGGVSAAAFIDWGGDKMLNGGKIHGQVTRGLEWEWADGVTDEEKRRFANSPKICACSQKGACISGISPWGSRVFSGENIFRPGEMENVCDTCYQEKVKCAPVPLAPGPPPFCEQLAMSPPQVRIVPITDEDNDYFNPKVKVIIGDLKGGDGEIGEKLDFPKGYGEDKAEWRSILDKDGITYYFKTYREKDKLCAEYLGTQSIDEKNPQFVRCFPAPPTPEPEVVEIVKSNTPGKQSNTLKIRMKMSENTCTYEARGTYSNGLCTFNVNAGSSTNIGPLSLKVVRPRIVKKTTDSNNEKSYIDNIIKGILESNPQQFKVLKEYDYVPDIETECKEFQGNKCKLNSLGQPEVEIKYKENSNSRMLCLSGWQPEPEEFVLERENKIIPLKLMGTKYIKYNAVYSKESNRFYYLPSKERETVDLLKIKRLQDQLDKIIFNKQGYVFFPDDNKQEKGKCSYCVKRNDEIDKAFKSGKGLKVVYKLTDVEHREKCNQGDDGCICSDGKCSRSKQYLNKNENDKPFYLRYEEVDCKDKDGKVLRDEKNEVQKCTQLKDQLIKADRTEVFYADKLCRFDLEGLKKKLKEKLKEIIKEQLKNKKPDLEKNNEKSYDHENKDVYTDDLSIKFDRVEIEAWGSGEAGHIKDTPINCESSVCSTESRAGMPGDYIKAKLKIDPNYPVIKVKVTEGGGNQENNSSDKDGGPIFIKMCRSDKQDCKPLITVAGGGMYRTYGPERTSYRDTIIHEPSLELEKTVIPASALKSTEDNKITYIEDGQVKYEIIECGSGLRSSKPGAGGCIYKSKEIYGKGSPGYVKIRPIIKEFDKEEINDAIEKVTRDLYDLEAMTDFSTKDLNVNIREKVEEEIKKELLR
ncbi:hypothetical protein [Wolbachia endosymbiont (group A) of Sympetrum striolatum]|uniref:hypothetical protein n=1 Tax=Wolbachia endosymbiont (group A) of Sympetrum striolatum TaxID=2954061 RepID=UPI0022261A51|nr:hypothetical protein [Wolbachia endosymbiont (group A) of Sympetrum striolatum]